MQEYFRILHSIQLRKNRKSSPDVLSLEDHVGLDFLENAQKCWPARDHKITHSGPSIPQIPTTAEQGLDALRTVPRCCGLRERDRGPDVIAEPILLLLDELEVDTPIAIQKSCNIGRFRHIHCVGLP